MPHPDDQDTTALLDEINDKMCLVRMHAHRGRNLGSFARNLGIGSYEIEQVRQFLVVKLGLVHAEEMCAFDEDAQDVPFRL